MKNILLVYRAQAFKSEIDVHLKTYKDDKVVLVVEDIIQQNIVNYLTKDYTIVNIFPPTFNIITLEEFLNGELNMKFDAVVANPPYQIKVGPNKTQPIWNKIVEQSLKVLKDGGTMTMIHPIGWRNISGDYRSVFDLYRSNNITQIDMHDVKVGEEVFNASTPFDIVYITKEPYQNKTELNFMDGTQKVVDITDLGFIPNSMFDKVMGLVAMPDEETVEVIKDSTYHTQRKHMSPEKVGDFKYPCCYSILTDGTINFWYSNIKKNHFNKPKVILGYGANPTSANDENGNYGVTQYCFGIVDEVKNLQLIQKALHSKKFQKISNESVKYTATQGHPLIHPNIVSSFRKDFWKDFV